MTASRVLSIAVLAVLAYFVVARPVAARNVKGVPTATSISTADDNPGPQGIDKKDIKTAPIPSPEQSSYRFLSSPEFYLAVIVSSLGLVALVMQFILLWKVKDLSAEEMLRVFAVTLVLLETVLFVAIGFSAEQIAPAMGLFGTVAGYLLGRTARERRKNDKGKVEQ